MLQKLVSPLLGPEAAPFLWLLQELDEGRQAALLTVTAVNGSAPRPLGTHMAVVSAERYQGYLSGGCVEPAIALEVEAVIKKGDDSILRFGKGSPFFDVRFPCGGGIDVLAHVNPDPSMIEDVLDRLADRRSFTLAFRPNENKVTLLDTVELNGWCGRDFHRHYLPATRLRLAGRGPELEAVARMGVAAQHDVEIATPDAETARRLSDLTLKVRLLSSPGSTWVWDKPADPWTATVVLFHEREWEEPILAQAIKEPGFYVGALGSVRTQAKRRERLVSAGHDLSAVDRIAGPIGIIPQARDPATLALSVLGEIAVRRTIAEEAQDRRSRTPC